MDDSIKPGKTFVHDGVSPIHVPNEEDEEQAFQMLWESRHMEKRGQRRGKLFELPAEYGRSF